ncbi:hypothetical protein [Streptomyces atratus]|uniref:hypothetical protein n=1 Tax=Streptomyces atratus TaxID=1893 RepID=UPI00224D426E|nr:hypothetical protein [Streptomyces atratus]MCX5345736.1 hypothetical protein [Streptomyces atratus]
MSAADVPPLDAFLLSHDHHGDDLDTVGRALPPTADIVLTTPAGIRKLGGSARGLAPESTTQLSAPGRPTIDVTAIPAATARPCAGRSSGP